MGKSDKDENNKLSFIENSKVMQELSEEIFHDFKNILATISGLAQLSMIKSQSGEVKDYLTHINQATFDFRDTLEKYYSFTSGYNQLEDMPFNFKGIMDKALEMVSYKLNKPNFYDNEIRLDIRMESESMVICNEHEIKQCFLNIMMNAIDAMEEVGGVLTVEIYEDESFATVNIIDTGIGIAEENLNNVFESKFTTKNYGTGLGLRIAKTTIEKLGGTINLESKVNHGTKVEMKFPIYHEE